MSASIASMLDFFRWNCSWYISGITKGNDRSQSIPSRAYDLWPARPFVIVVVDHTIPHKHISIRWIIVSSILMSSSFAASFFRSFSSEWKSWSSKQCSYLMNHQRRKDMNKYFKIWLQSSTITDLLTLKPLHSINFWFMLKSALLENDLSPFSEGRWLEPLLYFKAAAVPRSIEVS